MSDFQHNILSKDQLRLYLNFYSIAVLLKFALWLIISFHDYSFLPAWSVIKFFLRRIPLMLVETGVLLILAAIISNMFLFLFKRKKHFQAYLVAMELAMVFILNVMVIILATSLYAELIGNVDSMFMLRFIAINAPVMTFMSTGILISNIYMIWEERGEYARQVESLAMEQKNNAVKARLDKLTLELDPHYIFNGLSTISGLISTDPVAADEFLAKFASIFRYLLDNREDHLMSVKDEYRFMKQYADLLCYRYWNVELDISEDIAEVNGYIPTAAMQVLVENAIKHNAHTADKHLKIDVFFNNGYIAVRNNILPLEYAIDSTKVGLNNLSERYSYLTERTVKITNDGQIFCVEIPVLHEEDLFDE